MIDALHRVAGIAAEVAAVAVVHGTILALVAAALAATVLRRARPAVHAALWLVVLLKFLVPVGPGARFSLASLYDRATAAAPEPTVVMTFAPRGATVAPAPVPAAPRHPIALGLGALWLAVAAALGAREIRRYRQARRRAHGMAAAPDWLRADVERAAARLGTRAPAVRVGAVASPYVIGVIRPVLVVPAAMLDERLRLAAALAHELAHVRRVDGAVRVIQRAAACAWWWWPVVHWVNRRLDLAREQACDAYAVAHGPLDAHGYARLLITVARRHPAAAVGLGGSQLAQRVHALAHPRRAGIGTAGAAAIVGFAAIGLTGPGHAAAAPASTEERVCIFTPEIAAEILVSYPEADVDGNGALSKDEVCDFQRTMRERFVDRTLGEQTLEPGVRAQLVSQLSMRALPASVIDEASPLASDQLCCNCSAPTGQPAEFNPAIETCSRGVDP